jgi:hypothetical protein
MKKQSHTRQPDRKKKTVAEVRADNRRAQHTPTRHSDNKQVQCWDDLTATHQHCVGLLLMTRPVADLLRNKEMLKNLGSNVTKLTQLATTLLEDTRQFRADLDRINERHAGKSGGESDPNILMDALTIGQAYSVWAESYETVVLSNVQAILDMATSCLQPALKPEITSDQSNV